MTEHRSPRPAAEACLYRAHLRSEKDGTLVAEDVCALAAHEQRLGTPEL